MDNVTIILLLSTLLIAQSSADSIRYISGNLTSIDLINNSCKFSINDENSPSLVKNDRLCKILYQAYWRSQPVVIEITEISDEYYYAVSFSGGRARWNDEKTEDQIFQYQLFGVIQDVYYHGATDKCYIGLDTGFDNVRYNKQFHLTLSWALCARGINAFYSGEQLIMIGSVNLEITGPNSIVDLRLTNCQ